MKLTILAQVIYILRAQDDFCWSISSRARSRAAPQSVRIVIRSPGQIRKPFMQNERLSLPLEYTSSNRLNHFKLKSDFIQQISGFTSYLSSNRLKKKKQISCASNVQRWWIARACEPSRFANAPVWHILLTLSLKAVCNNNNQCGQFLIILTRDERPIILCVRMNYCNFDKLSLHILLSVFSQPVKLLSFRLLLKHFAHFSYFW